MAHPGLRQAARTSAGNSSRSSPTPGRLSKAGSLSSPQVVEAPGAPIYRKGSGLAQLAKFLQNAQRLRSPDGTQPAAADNRLPGTSEQPSDVAAEPSTSGAGKWNAATGLVMSHEVARQVQRNAKLKALQRTPHHLIIARIKELLAHLHQRAPVEIKAADDQDFTVPSWMAATKKAGDTGFQSGAASALPSARQDTGSAAGELPRQGSGARFGSVPDGLDDATATDELSIILMYLNPFLAKLPDEAREGLCQRMRLESINRDQTIYKQGEELQSFFLILSGIVEVSSRRMGNRSKTLLKKGQTLGERAILDAEPAAETCVAGSPVVALLVNRHDFLSVLEPYMMEEKRGMVDFLHTAVACLRDLPRGHIINLAQHLQQAEHADGAEFDCSDNNVYFVKAGTMQMRAMDKLLAGRQAETVVAETAASAPTMAATGPLSKVEIRDGHLMGTLGKQLPSKLKARACSRLLSDLGPATFFGGGSLLNGEGELQSALVCCAAGPVTLLSISISDFSKHATAEVLRAMRDEVCFRLTYYQGRAGLIGVDAVVGHSQASLGPSAEKPGKKLKAKTAKRKLAAQKGAAAATAQLAGDAVTEVEETTREQIVRYYTAVQQSNELTPPPTPTTRGSTRASRAMERYYSNGTPAERYWSTPAAQGSNKRQNVSSMLQSIFPDGLAPLAQKVAAMERKEQTKLQRQAACRPAAVAPPHTAALTSHAAPDTAALTSNAGQADSSVALVRAALSSAVDGSSSMAAAQAAIERSITASVNAALDIATSRQTTAAVSVRDDPASGNRKVHKHLGVSFRDTAATDSAHGLQSKASVQPSLLQASTASGAGVLPHHRTATAPAVGMLHVGDSSVTSGGNDAGSMQHHKHYSRGQKLAAAILWETASGKSQPVRLRQCLTYSEIRMKNLSCKDMATSRTELQDHACIAQ